MRGYVLADTCRFYEFKVSSVDASETRVRFDVKVTRRGRLRDFFGFNRAKHAVVEAAILATRTAFLPLQEINQEFQKLSVIVDKTGGPQEHAAFRLLEEHLRTVAAQDSHDPRHRTQSPALWLVPGLFGTGSPGWPASRQYGGVGLMIDKPGVEVSVAAAPTWSATGPCAERALAFAQQFMRLDPKSDAAFAITVEQCASEHTGLGAGTQLGLAVAKALAIALGEPALGRG